VKIVTVAAGLGSRLSANFIDIEKNNVTKFSKALHPVLGRPMVWWSINSFKHWLTLGEIKYDDLIFVVQDSHDAEFNISKELKSNFKPDIKMEKVNGLTKGPAETALAGIAQINDEEEIIVNDCDHHFSSDSFLSLIKFFREEKKGEDFLIISTVKTEPGIASWSYVETEELHENLYKRVLNIKEKDPYLASIGANGVIGSYYFSSKKLFLELYSSTFNDFQSEFYISKMFEKALSIGIPIFSSESKFGYPLGSTSEIELFENTFRNDLLSHLGKTLFFDIDGILIEHDNGFHSSSGLYNYNSKIISSNTDLLRTHFGLGDTIILTTSRPESERNNLIDFLHSQNMPFDHLIMGINPGVRILINDRKLSPFSVDTSQAISINRNGSLPVSFVATSLGKTIKDSLTSGSGAETLRLMDDNGSTYIRKLVPNIPKFDKEKSVLAIQNDWYRKVGEILPDQVPKVKYCGSINDMYCLDLEDLGDLPKFSDLLHLRQTKESNLKLSVDNLIKNLDLLYLSQSSINAEVQWMNSEVITSIILKKAFPALNSLILSAQENSKLEIGAERIIINNFSVENPLRILSRIIDAPKILQKNEFKLGSDFMTLVHGDLTLENILITENYEIKFIDPLSAMMDPSAILNNKFIREKTSPTFDLIKLMQSIDLNYEVWTNSSTIAKVNKDGSIQYRTDLLSGGLNSTIRTPILDYFKQLGVNTSEKNINFLLALQLFRIIPYKMNRHVDQAWFCFALGSQLLEKGFE
jgi:NDP-sugar pyrophosphorylase family protein